MKLVDGINNKEEINELDDIFIRYWHNGKPTHYFVSPTNNGVYSEISGKKLKPSIKNGYHEYHLYIDGLKITKTYNNLIGLTALIGDKRPELTEVDHINGDKSDNDYKRLEWVTHGENNRRARINGQNPSLVGENNGYCKYSVELLAECVHLLLIGKSIVEVSDITSVPTRELYSLINGRRKDVANGVEFPETIYSHPHKNKRATTDEVRGVRVLRSQGLTARQISERLNIPIQKVYNIFYYKR